MNTTTLQPGPVQPVGPVTTRPPRPRPVVGALWLVAFGYCVWTIQRAGAPLLDVLLYAVYFGGCVVLPGMLLLRLLTSGRRTLAEEVGLGTAAGLAYELAGWAVWTGLGLPWMQLVWALAVPVVFAAVPGLRRYWRSTAARRLPVWWSAGLALVCAAAVTVWYGGSIYLNAIPPTGRTYYPDLLWHLALVQEAGRSVPPQIPQVAGETMQYHWFADAHLASAAHITGLDPAMIVFRLWFAPLLVAVVLCVAALARQVGKAWWTGPAAAFAAVVVTRVAIWDWFGFSAQPVQPLSPTQTYGSLLSLAVAAVLLPLLFGRQPRRAWILVALLFLASSGAKPTTIPLVLAGTGVAGLFVLIRHRRIHRAALLTGVGLVVLALVAARSVTGSTAGTAIRLFGPVRILPGYAAVTGDTGFPQPGAGVIVAGLENPDGAVIEWAVLILLSVLLALATCVIPLLLPFERRLRTDPVHWWLFGVLLGGWLGFLLVDHPGAAEYYFIGSALPFGVVLTTSLVVAGLRGRAPRVRRTVLIASAGVAALVAVLIRTVGNVSVDPGRDSGDAITAALLRPLIWFAVIVLLAVAGWLLARQYRPSIRGLGIAVAAAAVLGLTFAGRMPHEWGTTLAMKTPDQPPWQRPPYSVQENEAADWVRHNVPDDDVVATNTLCLLPRRVGECDARGYLVSGIGGRRAYIEGWAYTPQSMANQTSTTHYTELPSPWPDRVGLTYRAIAQPSVAVMDELKVAGVRWLFVDDRFSAPDVDALAAVADLRFDNGKVQIFQLR